MGKLKLSFPALDSEQRFPACFCTLTLNGDLQVCCHEALQR